MSEAFLEVHIDVRHGAERVEMKGSRDAADECKDCRDARNQRLRLCHDMLRDVADTRLTLFQKRFHNFHFLGVLCIGKRLQC